MPSLISNKNDHHIKTTLIVSNASFILTVFGVINQILLNFLSLTLILSLRAARSLAADGFLSVAGGSSWESSEGV